LYRLASLYRFAVSGIALELRRHPGAHTELRTVLQVVMKVRFAATARVAALAYDFTGLHALPRLNGHRALSQVGEERIFARTVVDDHVVAERAVVLELSRLVVGRLVERRHHHTACRRQDGVTEAVVVGVLPAVTGMSVAVSDDHQV